MNDILYQYNPWWEEEIVLNAVERASYLDLLYKTLRSKEVIFLTGLRRVGKTTLLKFFIHELITKQNIKPTNIFYVSLDHIALKSYTIHDIVNQFRQAHKIHLEEKVYLFFDEVTYKNDYQQELKNLYDLQNVKIYASSSSASLLKDKKAFLTGREKVIEVFPLSFEEYLQFRQIKILKSETYLMKSYFEEYMKTGGIPQYVLTGEYDYLKELVDNIIYKDIIAFHNIKDSSLIKDFFFLLMERVGKQISLNKVANILNISVDTVKRYLSYFEDTHLIHLVSRYGTTNERIRSPKKIYTGDVGIRSMVTGFRDKGAVFENLVYLKIKSLEPEYFVDKAIEIDFILNNRALVEVKYMSEMNSKQKEVFDSYDAGEKIIISGIDDYLALT